MFPSLLTLTSTDEDEGGLAQDMKFEAEYRSFTQYLHLWIQIGVYLIRPVEVLQPMLSVEGDILTDPFPSRFQEKLERQTDVGVELSAGWRGSKS